MRRVVVGLVLIAGCKQIGEEIDEEFLPDKQIRMSITSPLVVGETGVGAFTDACTDSDNEECETDAWVFEQATVSGALVSAGLVAGTQISAVAKKQPGTATVTITAVAGSARSSASATVSVLPPEEIVVKSACRNFGDAPYLVPPDTRVQVRWSMILLGKDRLGDDGEVHAVAPLLTLVDQGVAGAVYTTPSSGGTIEVRSNLGPSGFEFLLYDPAALSLVIAPHPQAGDPAGILGFTVMGRVDGRVTCEDTGAKTVTTETPAVCMLRDPVTSQPAMSREVTGAYFQVIRVAAGTCRLRATSGTVPEAILDTEI